MMPRAKVKSIARKTIKRRVSLWDIVAMLEKAGYLVTSRTGTLTTKAKRTSRTGTLPPKRVRICVKKAANPKRARRQSFDPVKAAVSLSTKFHQLLPQSLKKINIACPDNLVELGRCVQVNYVTDKFDEKPREYWHRFEGPAKLLATSTKQPNGDTWLIIAGKFKVKKEGITG